MGLEINYAGNYSRWHHFCRAINPFQKNCEDLKTVAVCLAKLEEITETLDVISANSCISDELIGEVRGAEVLLARINSQWFVSPSVRKSAKALAAFTTSYKIATSQHVPYKVLVGNEKLRNFILTNHLHHKITKQHQKIGHRIKLVKGEPHFPLCVDLDREEHRAKIKWVSFQNVLSTLKPHPKSMKVEHLQFLANGLEIHDAKKWQTLRPQYIPTLLKDGNLVHIDTLTGKEEVIGNANSNYIQLVNVKPWGYNPQGGSLFGHTWIRLVIDGQLYHVGADLGGNIVNPDFMATVPASNKEFSTSEWVAIDDSTTDEHGKTKSERLFKKLESLQHYLTTKKMREDCPYAEDIQELYHQMRTSHGGTCTSAATMLFREVTGVCYLQQSKPLASRIVFNPVTRWILDIFWYFTPKPIDQNIIQPLRIITRGALPEWLGTKLQALKRLSSPFKR